MSAKNLSLPTTSSDVNRNTDPLPEPEVKEVVDTWVDLLKIPTVAGGYIHEDDNFLTVNTKWSADDAAKKERLSFSRTFAVLKSSLGSATPIISTPGSVLVDEKLSVPSKSGKLRSILVEKSGTGDAKTEFLQIWDQSTLLKTYNLTELDLHKAVYTSDGWGITMAWSPDESKIAYLAEKKVPKAKSFYSSAAAPVKKDSGDDKDKTKFKSDKETDDLGEEYVYRQTWGEQLNGQYNSVIVVLDLSTDEFKVLPLPEAHFPTDIQWASNSHIIGTTYPLPIWRLGLIYCTNRESIIFSVGANGENFQLITEPNKASRSPRVRPDGGYLVWQERILDGAHDRARAIHGIQLQNGVPPSGAQPQLLYSSSPANGIPVYSEFPRNCWSADNSTLYSVTPNEAKMILLAIPIADPSTAQKIEGVTGLLSITKDYLLVASSTTVTGPSINLLNISQDYRPIPITAPFIPPIGFPVEIQFVSGEMSPPAIYHGPEGSSVPPNSVPLVVYPHGGPHSTFVDGFDPTVILFLKLGFAIIRLNYVGSIGGIRDTANDLLGKVGTADVKDCQGIVEKVLSSMPCLNPNKVVVFGGSHGGFLAAHLSSQYPSTYKAAVMRNPVTDMNTLVGTSDITDWTYAEAGVTFPEDPIKTLIPTARDLTDAQKYISASPIHNVDKVEAATLLLLGSEDLRVPAQQGIGYYRALKAFGKTAEIRLYPDAHPLGKTPVRLDNIIHSALWFKRYLR